MKSFLRILTIVALGLTSLIITIHSGRAEWIEGKPIPAFQLPLLAWGTPQYTRESLLSSACAVRPSSAVNKYRRLPSITAAVPLSRFRQDTATVAQVKDINTLPNRSSTEGSLGDSNRLPNRLPNGSPNGLPNGLPNTVPSSLPMPTYRPREEVMLAHPTNFGRRFLQDVNGKPVQNDPIVVLHETVGSAWSTINYFRTPHPLDDDQVSYHTLIREDGTISYMVPPDRRAFGAGNSVFRSALGNEGVKTNPNFPPSVNNFAYHISLVSPPDGRGNSARHSGYTKAQYQSLAWLVAKTGVPSTRITTHQLVDRSGSRRDPRSFDAQLFSRLLATYPRDRASITMQCTAPAIPQEE